jgi:RNA recognition motif-containing protein
MEIVKFEPNQKGIEERRAMSRFGRIKTDKDITSLTKKAHAPPIFTLASGPNVEVDRGTLSKSQDVYVFKQKTFRKPEEEEPSSQYLAPSLRESPVTLRFTNIPLEMKSRDLEALITSKTGLVPLSTNVVHDKETKAPKGYAFSIISTEENAKKAIEVLNGLSVDNLVIGVDRARRLY